MQLLDEKEKTVVDMSFDMSDKEIKDLLAYGKKIYTIEQQEKDIINFAVNALLKEKIKQIEGEKNESDDKTDEAHKEG